MISISVFIVLNLTAFETQFPYRLIICWKSVFNCVFHLILISVCAGRISKRIYEKHSGVFSRETSPCILTRHHRVFSRDITVYSHETHHRVFSRDTSLCVLYFLTCLQCISVVSCVCFTLRRFCAHYCTGLYEVIACHVYNNTLPGFKFHL